jgi:natural product biosynthesis luciferase-like monooxygenase protein
VHAWRVELGHPASMVNMFGQTETCGIVATYEVPRDLAPDGIVPIGRPIPGVEVMAVGEDGAPVGAGQPGELVVAGPTLGLGYVGLEEATRERFQDVTSGPLAGRRVYRSGDRVRPRADGVMDFLGRLDTQVKVRGHRVELEEVEARLAAHPEIKEAAVIAGAGPGDETNLVGVVVPVAGASIDAASIRRFVAAGLPDYMVPASVKRTDALPRTPNGKIDRGALPDVSATRLTLSQEYVAPRTDDERLVASVWGALLGVEEVGASDDFFELGGHSLLAMRVMARIRTEAGVGVPVRVLFENPTVSGLAGRIGEARSKPADSGRPPLTARPDSGTDGMPSFAQRRLWLLHQMDSESAAYNLLAAIRLIGSLDRSALERAVARVVERHESLRMVFPSVGGEPRARITPAEPVSLDVVAVADEAALRAQVKESAGRPYDLEGGPLFRAELLALGPEEHVLVLGIHHIVSDGWSRGVLYDEIARLYSAFAAGDPDPLPPLPVQYRDYVAWQEEWFDGDALDAQVKWWTEHLSGAPGTSEFPTQRPRAAMQSFRGDTVTFPVSESLARSVRQLCAEEGASPFMIYLAALSTLIGRYSGQEDVVVGSPTAGRADPQTEPLIGFFVNTLALRLDTTPERSFRELVRRAREVSLGAFAHQDLPFDRVVDALKLPRDLSRSPLFQVMLILQNTPPATHRPAGLTMSQVDVPLDAAKYDVTLSLVAGEHGLTGHLEYNTDLFDRDFIEKLGGHYVELLDGALAQPDTPLGALPLLTPAEERMLLVEWNDTERALDEGTTMHGLFECQARATPDATAIVFGDERLTYQELDQRATRMAWYLRGLGVDRETLVGVSIDRSIEMMVGLLGILKAGGAYVPLDPTYPRDRIAFMIEDSGCPVLLTREHLLDQLPSGGARRVCLDRDWTEIEAATEVGLPEVDPEQLAYVIFTSGSTGRPKGVMVEHRNVANFFVGMDERIDPKGPITWLAVTSISFDISVLELFWTLARGCAVVIQADEPQATVGMGVGVSAKPINFSLFYFASESQTDRTDPYHLLFEGARFADANDFSAVWVPERHFHEFGGIYPSPAVMASALSMVTRNVKIRTGSVVLPLHDTVRVAEDWAVVDNLSNGRVQLSFASGWHDRDFIFQPQNYENRRDVMIEQMDELRRLWRGESITRKGGEGTPHEISTYPRPIQSELPIFVTAAGTPQTYVNAGREGAHLLTHLLGQSVEQLAEKIQLYRKAWDEAGHPGRGTVALMMHTFLGEDLEEVREIVRGPFRDYLRSSVGLIAGLAKGRGQDIRSAEFSDEDMEALLDHAFERYFETSALMGTPETCLATVERLKALDVDDVACLIDFGVPESQVVASLDLLAQLRRDANVRTEVEAPETAADDEYVSVPAQIVRHDVTHMQCTPSYAEMVLAQPGGPEALARLECLMVGGEALPLSLARQLGDVVGGRLLNMYGPTETTIWSSTETVDPSDDTVSLGRPIANTDLYVVDRGLQPVPVGVPGELLIGGRGVVRGYWERPELTAERFVAHPVKPGARVYRTGDLVRYRTDGRLDFLGRLDHQVKVRGHRIELGEIEALLGAHGAVRETVVVAREDVAGDKRLVGYVVVDSRLADAEQVLRDALRLSLPEWMVPQHIVVLDALPRTPNGKTDRKALPAPDVAKSSSEYVAPTSNTEQVLAEVWQEVLRRTSVGVEDNFFDLGGHSLLTVRVQAMLRERLERVVPITDLFRFPTIRTLAARLGTTESSADAGKVVTEAATERADARRSAIARRRGRS